MKYSIAVALAAAAGASAQACGPVHLIYARATSEPPTSVDSATPAQWEAKAKNTWSQGYGAAGYSLYSNLTKAIPGATGYPVHYPASFSGCSSENKGVDDLVNQLSAHAAKCPQTKYVLGGHSQGGVVTTRALNEKIPKDLLPRILAVTMFGSPACPANVAGKCKSYCNEGDAICTGSGGGLAFGRCSSTGASTGSSSSGLGGGSAAKSGSGSSLLSGLFGRLLGKREASPVSAPTLLAARQAKPPRPAGCDASLVSVEKGHKAGGALGAHMAYNADGYYIRAAVCYIYEKLYTA